MRRSRTGTGSAEDGGGVALWAVLLFAFTLAGALDFVVAGLNPDDPPQSSATLLFVPAGIVLTAYAPSLAALIVAARAGGARALVRQVGRWRVGVGWYALVLIGPFVLVLSADLIYVLSGGAPPETWLVFPSSLAFVGPLVAGSLGEELGWRGFAQPRLQSRYNALRASIIVGVIWGTWHLWPAITPGGFSDLSPSDLTQTYVRLISTAVIYAWLYNSTNGGLFARDGGARRPQHRDGDGTGASRGGTRRTRHHSVAVPGRRGGGRAVRGTTNALPSER